MEFDVLTEKTFLTPGEVSRYLGVPLATIYVWYQLGKIDGINLNGKSLRLFSQSVARFLASRFSGDSTGTPT